MSEEIEEILKLASFVDQNMFDGESNHAELRWAFHTVVAEKLRAYAGLLERTTWRTMEDAPGETGSQIIGWDHFNGHMSVYLWSEKVGWFIPNYESEYPRGPDLWMTKPDDPEVG